MPNGIITTTADFTNGERANTGTADTSYGIPEDIMELLFPYATKDPDLLGYWRFEETSGVSAADETGDYPGIIEGAAVLNQPGVFDRCIEFDGSNADINLGAAISGIVQSITFLAWIKVTAISGNATRRIGGNRGGGASGTGWELVLNRNTLGSNIVFQTSPSVGGASYAIGTTDLRDGLWHLVAATYDYSSGVSRVYVDGLDDTDTSLVGSGVISNALNTYLGRTYQAGYFDEYMDEPKLYSRALAAEEIYTLYNGGHQYANSGTWLSPSSASEEFGDQYKETDDEFTHLTLALSGGTGTTYIQKVEIWDSDRKTLLTTATGPFDTTVTLTAGDFDNGLDETDVNCKIKLFLIGDYVSTLSVVSIAWISYTPPPPAPPTPTYEPMERWRMLKNDGVTEEIEFFDATLVTTFNRFARRGIIVLMDLDGTAYLTYKKGYLITIQVHPEGDGIFHDIFGGFVMDVVRKTSTTELSVLSHDLWLKKRDVFRSYTNKKVSSILLDLITTYTPLIWNTGLVNVLNDVEVTRKWNGERLDEVINELSSISSKEEFGATNDMEFFFRPREIVACPQDFYDGDYIEAEFPQHQRQEINRATVYYGRGSSKKSVTVQSLDKQQELADEIGSAKPVVMEVTKHFPEITTEEAAILKAQNYIGSSENPLMGKIRGWGTYDILPGQVTFVEAPDEDVAGNFRISSIEYQYLTGEMILSVIENYVGVLDSLVNMTEDIVRVDMRDIDVEAPATNAISLWQPYKIIQTLRAWKMTVPPTMFIAGERYGNVGDPGVGGGLVGDNRGNKEEYTP